MFHFRLPFKVPARLTAVLRPKVEKPTDIPVPVRVGPPAEKRKPSLFGRKKSSQQEIQVKIITREEYWKHHAKDENGKYIGSEDPAEDAGVVKGLNWSRVYSDGKGWHGPVEEVIVDGIR